MRGDQHMLHSPRRARGQWLFHRHIGAGAGDAACGKRLKMGEADYEFIIGGKHGRTPFDAQRTPKSAAT
jgi:hypothetical protein